VLLGRGMLGDGSIDLRGFRERVDATGFSGAMEVEIFNLDLRALDGAEALADIADRYRRHVP
jgi:sugar phosphate isomerase/epimerase